MKSALQIIAVAVAMVGLSLLAFVAQRELNYRAAYQDKVRETVRELVKPECLKP